MLLSHLNTLLFGLISLGICVLMMFFIAIPAFQGYVIFCLTVGIGLAIVTLMAFSAVVNEETVGDGVDDEHMNISLVTCPDYWSSTWQPEGRGRSNVVTSCSPSNQLWDPVTNTAIQVRLVAWVTGCSTGESTTFSSINLSEHDATTDANVCKFVGGSMSDENVRIPWTRVRPYCPKNDPYPK
jgi:hypothetical protein